MVSTAFCIGFQAAVSILPSQSFLFLPLEPVQKNMVKNKLKRAHLSTLLRQGPTDTNPPWIKCSCSLPCWSNLLPEVVASPPCHRTGGGDSRLANCASYGQIFLQHCARVGTQTAEMLLLTYVLIRMLT